jgi:hypothetical protein
MFLLVERIPHGGQHVVMDETLLFAGVSPEQQLGPVLRQLSKKTEAVACGT